MKYEYMLKVWGGFFNKEYRDQHNIEEGYYYFDKCEDRSVFIKKLEDIEKNLKAHYLMVDCREGYNLRTDTVLHRVINYQGKDYHSSRNLGRGYPFYAAETFLENNWYLGFNDYPLGEDFDYSSEDIEVVSEWIDGSFCIEEGL